MRQKHCISLILLIVFLPVFTPNKANSSNNPSATENATQQAASGLDTLQIAPNDLFSDVVWSPSFKWLAVASCKSVFLYQDGNYTNDIQLSYVGDGCIEKLAFLSENTLALSATSNTAELWDIGTEHKLQGLEFNLDNHDYILALAFDASTSSLLAGSAHKISIWNVNKVTDQQLFTVISTDFFGALSVAFDPGRFLVAVETTKDTIDSPENSVVFWDLRTKTKIARLDTGTTVARTMKFSPDGKLLAIGGETGTVQLWNTGAKEIKSFFEMNPDIVISVAFSPDGKYLAAATTSNITVWNVESGDKIASLIINIHYSASLSFNKDDSIIVLGLDDKVQLWKL